VCVCGVERSAYEQRRVTQQGEVGYKVTDDADRQPSSCGRGVDDDGADVDDRLDVHVAATDWR